MRVSNELAAPPGPTGAFAELFKLQSEFQARLAEETLRYLRRLQSAVVPASPGTVVLPSEGLELRAEGMPGTSTELVVEVENLQRMHCMVSPQLTPLVSPAGVTWFPEAESGAGSRLLPPAATERIAIAVAIPASLPGGEYRGALVLQGFRQSALPVAITVKGRAAPPVRPSKAPRKSSGGGRKSR